MDGRRILLPLTTAPGIGKLRAPRPSQAALGAKSAGSHSLAEALDRLVAADVEHLFSSDDADCHTPQLSFRTLQERLEAGRYGGAAQLAHDFRAMCDGVVLSHSASDPIAAQAASRLLDRGNRVLAALASPAGLPPLQPAPEAAYAGHAFWLGVLPLQKQYLAFEAARSKGSGLHPGQGAGGEAARGTKRSHADALPAYRCQQPDEGASKRKRHNEVWGDEAVGLQGVLAGMLEALAASCRPAGEAPADETIAQRVSREGRDLPEQGADGRGSHLPVGRVAKVKGAQLARVLESQSWEAAAPLQPDFGVVRAALRLGAYTCAEDVAADVHTALLEAAHDAADRNPGGTRRAKLVALGEAAAGAIAAALGAVVAVSEERAFHRALGGAPGVRLPSSILANREPYRQGEWVKQAYPRRPYVRLSAYDDSEDPALIGLKLQTSRAGSCSGLHCTTGQPLGTYSLETESFCVSCSCLARNLECGPECGCQRALPEAPAPAPAPTASAGVAAAASVAAELIAAKASQHVGRRPCQNRAVTERRTLQLGADVQEVDSWGIDCYTFRNIVDAAVEGGAFKGQAQGGITVAPQPATPQVLGPGPARLAHSLKAELDLEDAAQPGAAGPQVSGLQGEREAASVWVERELLPAINRQGLHGWDMLLSLKEISKRRAPRAGSADAPAAAAAAAAAEAVSRRIEEVGPNYFRVHPKGVGLVCTRPGGLPPLTFVEEYFGEVHTPWRWFEIQDAVRKAASDELPDFYNIMLERPRDDPAGYDVLFIDAAHKGSIASRMSHSCTPNCQAVIMSAGGRLTIAMYTLRHIAEGVELTFDYACVTESEKEFHKAICLCGMRGCKGSFLSISDSNSFQQVMKVRHTVLHRQALLLRAAAEPLTPEDAAVLQSTGFATSLLGGTPPLARLPAWLEKWAALTLTYIGEEHELLPKELLHLYAPATAQWEAKGVRSNRVQNVAITLNKVQHCLLAPGQCQGPPLALLSEEQAISYLWAGPVSVALRAVRAALCALADPASAPQLAAACSAPELQAAAEASGAPEELQNLARGLTRTASSLQDARTYLQEVARGLEQLGARHAAAADLLKLYVATLVWLRVESGYQDILSEPVRLDPETLTKADLPSEPSAQQRLQEQLMHLRGQLRRGDRAPVGDLLVEEVVTLLADSPPSGSSTGEGLYAKHYGPLYIWGQLSSWDKQTVSDSTASLAAERQGAFALPDIESAYGPTLPQAYEGQATLVGALKSPAASPWPPWATFHNAAGVYGSPAFDAVWSESKP